MFEHFLYSNDLTNGSDLLIFRYFFALTTFNFLCENDLASYSLCFSRQTEVKNRKLPNEKLAKLQHRQTRGECKAVDR